MIDEALLARLAVVAEERCRDAGPAHDWLHVRRVADNARRIGAAEGADPAICVPAALLHELFNYPKDHPDSARSGDVCAEHAAIVLHDAGAPAATIAPICGAIRVHGFSRGVVPDALEARVLQDADRLDAIGAIGVARCFATSGELRRAFYDPDDPLCRRHEPDDKRWAIDHVYKKLLRIADGLHTETARELATPRVAFLHGFLDMLAAELGA